MPEAALLHFPQQAGRDLATTDLPVSPSHPSYARLNAILRLEREYLTQALADHGGNVSRAGQGARDSPLQPVAHDAEPQHRGRVAPLGSRVLWAGSH